jgi:hypothetical protein
VTKFQNKHLERAILNIERRERRKKAVEKNMELYEELFLPSSGYGDEAVL